MRLRNLMNRRNFLKVLAGVALVPSAMARALSSEPVPTFGNNPGFKGMPYLPEEEGVEIHKYLRSNWWIVCGKDQADILRKLPEFTPITVKASNRSLDERAAAVRLIGALSIKGYSGGVNSDQPYRVFEDDYLPPEMMLVGRKDLLEQPLWEGRMERT